MNVITAMQRSRDKFRNAYRELADTPMGYKPKGCWAHYRDDGKGYDPRNHTGKHSMRER